MTTTSSRHNTTIAQEFQVTHVPLDRVVGGLNNRTVFDGLEDLASSMNALGLAQPVLLRPVMLAPQPGEAERPVLTAEERTVWERAIRITESLARYQIVAGERRVRAARLIPWTTIPALVRPIATDAALLIVLTENLKRTDPDPIDEATGYQGLITRCGYTPAEVAARLSVPEQRVVQRLKLLQLRPLYQDQVRKLARGEARNAFLLGHALLMADLDPQRQDVAWDLFRTSDRAPTVDQFRHMCAELGDAIQTELFDLSTLYQAKLLAAEQTGLLARAPVLPVADHLPAPEGWRRRMKAGNLAKLYADQLAAQGFVEGRDAIYALIEHLLTWGKMDADTTGWGGP